MENIKIGLARYNTAIFVHGCFWHRHEGCKYAYMPKSRIDFWTEKFKKNTARDIVVRKELENTGIKMLIVWECTVNRMIKDEKTLYEVLNAISIFLHSKDIYAEI